MNLFLESGIRIKEVTPNEFNKHQNHFQKFFLTQQIQRLEIILSEILKKQIEFSIDSTKRYGCYLTIIDKNTGGLVLQDLNQLSTGESTLFSMFAIIIKHSTDGEIERG